MPLSVTVNVAKVTGRNKQLEKEPMGLISVKAKPGRIARVSPKGAYIPQDRYILVDDTPYIRRLLNHHKDLELEPAKTKAAKNAGPLFDKDVDQEKKAD